MDDVDRPLKINYDNKSTEIYAKINYNLSKSKYIDIKYLTAKERIQNVQVSIEYIWNDSMLTDSFTKALPPKILHQHVMSVTSFI